MADLDTRGLERSEQSKSKLQIVIQLKEPTQANRESVRGFASIITGPIITEIERPMVGDYNPETCLIYQSTCDYCAGKFGKRVRESPLVENVYIGEVA